MDSTLNSWRGASMDDIYNKLDKWNLEHVLPVKPDEIHSVLYHLPISDSKYPPKPHKGFNKWDSCHVHLPCSPKNQYPVIQKNGTTTIEPRWKMIEDALKQPIQNSRDLEKSILFYNSKYANSWKFDTLHQLFEQDLNEEESAQFFTSLLPKIIILALRLPELLQTAIPLLKKKENRTVSLSQQQVACLLANAFLCTFPRRNTIKRNSEYYRYPDINFNRLYQSTGQSCMEKIKCLCHYFRRVCTDTPIGVVTFQRRYISKDDFPKWEDQCALIGETKFHISSEGTIEDDGGGLLQVDFANKYVGGGVLGHGCVQEEIRFVICPELMLSKLFTEELEPQEALLMIGCEQYSTYSGYSSSFTWNGNYEDKTPYDLSRRRKCHIVAIDAKEFQTPKTQYTISNIERELNKAYVGFYHPLNCPAPGLATGNWGCGAFGGDARLKSLLQLIVCTVIGRPIVYFTFGDERLREEVYELFLFCKNHQITAGQMYRYILEFNQNQLLSNQLYAFLVQQFYDSQQDVEKSTNKSEPNITDNLETTLPSTSFYRNKENESNDQLNLKKTIEKVNASSEYVRHLVHDDLNFTGSLQSRFADLDIPTKKRASNSPMESSMKKKSMLDALDQDYYNENALPTEKFDRDLRTDSMANEPKTKLESGGFQSTLQADAIEGLETHKESSIENINIMPVNKLIQNESAVTSPNHTSQISTDSDVLCSPVTVLQSSSRLLTKLVHSNFPEQKSKISDYFMPNA